MAKMKKEETKTIDFLDQTILKLLEKEEYVEVEVKDVRYEGKGNLVWTKYSINKHLYEEGVSAEDKSIDKSNLIAEGYERLRSVMTYLTKKKDIFVMICSPKKMVFRKR